MPSEEIIQAATKAIAYVWPCAGHITVSVVHNGPNYFWLKLKKPAVLSSALLKSLNEQLHKSGVRLNGWDTTYISMNFFLEAITNEI